MKNKFGVSALALAAMLIGASASAQVYVGADLGSAAANVDCTGVSDCKTHSTAVNLFGGYGFMKYLAVEAGYFDLGKVDGSFSSTYNQQAVVSNFTTKSSGIDAALLLHTEFDNDWALFAKVGVARVTADNTIGGTVGSTVVAPYSVSYDSTVPFYGFGVMYRYDAKLQFRLTMDRRKIKAYDENGIDASYSVNGISFGAQYSF